MKLTKITHQSSALLPRAASRVGFCNNIIWSRTTRETGVKLATEKPLANVSCFRLPCRPIHLFDCNYWLLFTHFLTCCTAQDADLDVDRKLNDKLSCCYSYTNGFTASTHIDAAWPGNTVDVGLLLLCRRPVCSMSVKIGLDTPLKQKQATQTCSKDPYKWNNLFSHTHTCKHSKGFQSGRYSSWLYWELNVIFSVSVHCL